MRDFELSKTLTVLFFHSRPETEKVVLTFEDHIRLKRMFFPQKK